MRKKKKSFSFGFDFSEKKKILFWGKFENKKILLSTDIENGYFRSENEFSNSTRATTTYFVTWGFFLDFFRRLNQNCKDLQIQTTFGLVRKHILLERSKFSKIHISPKTTQKWFLTPESTSPMDLTLGKIVTPCLSQCKNTFWDFNLKLRISGILKRK